MMHNRKLVIGSVSLTTIKLPAVRLIFTISNTRDKVESMIDNYDYFEGAPFQWIGIITREGTIDKFRPKYGKIDAKDGKLLILIEVDIRKIIRRTTEDIERKFFDAIIYTLTNIVKRYNLNVKCIKGL